jgi:hypothetical protein
MTTPQELTFEDVDAYLNGLDLNRFAAGGEVRLAVASSATNPVAALGGICDAYRVIRPILKLVAGFALLPKKWRKAVKTFLGVMDALCP